MTLLGQGRHLGPLSPSAQRVFDLVTREPGLTHYEIYPKGGYE